MAGLSPHLWSGGTCNEFSELDTSAKAMPLVRKKHRHHRPLPVFKLDTNGIGTVGTHISNKCDGSQVVSLSAHAREHGRKHIRAGRPIRPVMVTGEHRVLARPGQRDAIRIELSASSEHLLGKRKCRVQ